MKKALLVALATLWISQAGAQTPPGVAVYPGAKAAPEVAASLKKAMGIAATTFRTGDSVEKVANFYRKQGLQEEPGTSKEGASFAGKGVHLTIQNPWADMATGKVNNDTLLSIVRKK